MVGLPSKAFSVSAIITALRHAACVLSLMWVALANGQALFFSSDSTNYVRAADVAVYLASGKTLSTVWTDRYRSQLTPKSTVSGMPSSEAAGQQRLHSTNDLKNGVIMGGRSPYIGALMYAGYVIGDFWPFILLQAGTAYILIILALRRFGVGTPFTETAVTFSLAVATALPGYNSMLLADAFTGFGILAVLLLATPGRLRRLELGFLFAVLAVFAISHLTHIMILIGMSLMLGLLHLLRVISVPKRGWTATIGGILLGAVSIQATAFATTKAFGREPQLLPLLSARFIADGPGKAYIDSGCDQNRYQICRIPIGNPHSDALILFGATKETGAYMLAGPAERRRMGEEDVAFAMSVLRFDSIGQMAKIAENTIRQLFWIEYAGLNQDCFARPNCWNSLPTPVREELKSTPSGKGLWAEAAMTIVIQAAIVASLIALIVLRWPLSSHEPKKWRTMSSWLLLLGAAMLVNSFFGGAVAEPQYRYQTRISWLIPLAAAIALLAYLRSRSASRAPASEDRELEFALAKH